MAQLCRQLRNSALLLPLFSALSWAQQTPAQEPTTTDKTPATSRDQNRSADQNQIDGQPRTVQIDAYSPQLQTDRSDVMRTYSDQQTVQLPFARRNVHSLLELTPGVAPGEPALSELLNPRPAPYLHINGQSQFANQSLLDGVDNNEPFYGFSIYTPHLESVQQLVVTTSNYQSELGRAGGGVYNITTRDGFNKLHGSVFGFHTNQELRARNPFSTEPLDKPIFIRNQFGAVIGGPVISKRLFVAGSYEGNYRRGARTTIASVPILPWRQGDFSGIGGSVIFDPLSGNLITGSGRSAFTGNQIPRSRFNSNAIRLLSLFPEPNLPGLQNNLAVNVPIRNDGNSFDGRVDANISGQTGIFGHYNFSRFFVVSNSPFGPQLGESAESRIENHLFAFATNHSFTPTFLTELRLGYNRYRPRINAANVNRDLRSSLAFLNGSTLMGEGPPRIEINGMDGFGATELAPLSHADNVFTIANTWSGPMGRNLIRGGIDFRHIRSDGFLPSGSIYAPRGLFSFASGPTSSLSSGAGDFGFANSFASFLLGAPSQTAFSIQSDIPTNRQWQYFAFLQDTFKVLPRVTLDLGVRYELYMPVESRFPGGLANFDATTNSLLISGEDGDVVNQQANIATDWNNFAPRLGFAVQLAERSVMRGGYGISYFRPPLAFYEGLLANQFAFLSSVQTGREGTLLTSGSFNQFPIASALSPQPGAFLTPVPDQPFISIAREDTTPYVQFYNLTFQQEFTEGFTASLGYVGNVGRKMPYSLQLNAALPGAGLTGLPLNQQFGRLASTVQRGFGINSNYNSLQADVVKRFGDIVNVTASYTLGKTFDYATDFKPFLNNMDIRSNYSLSDYDRTHIFTLSHIINIPLGAGSTS